MLGCTRGAQTFRSVVLAILNMPGTVPFRMAHRQLIFASTVRSLPSQIAKGCCPLTTSASVLSKAATRTRTTPEESSTKSNSQSNEQDVKFKLASKSKPKRLVPPKRPWSIMQLVIESVVAEQKSATGSISSMAMRDCFRLAGEKYRSLSEGARKSYQEELDKRRQVYEAEMRQFLDSLTPQDYVNQNEYIRRRRALGRSTARRGIPKFDPNAPKRPLNGFMLFCADVRANPTKFGEYPGLSNTPTTSITEESKVLAAYWREMQEDVKQSYVTEATRLREQYKQEKERYDNQVKAKQQ
ncbi:high mobility group box domain-containing protein [Melampsora americana]|nr:high mobility group box domain-containing protein [Melampsora americana]